MLIHDAMRIAKREWNNIRISLYMCGDIGDFESNFFIKNKKYSVLLCGGMPYVKNLINMNTKLDNYGYSTLEASRVFTTLTISAVKKLGLQGSLAHDFAVGYSLTRTGLFDLYIEESAEQKLIQQFLFYNLFFRGRKHFNWGFDSEYTKSSFKMIYYLFLSYQETGNPFSKFFNERK
ncbi:MAG: hypothetical protein ACRENO_10610, partial [Thermodesulfobacteriota bacterium]